jgi:hypothetical protein
VVTIERATEDFNPGHHLRSTFGGASVVHEDSDVYHSASLGTDVAMMALPIASVLRTGTAARFATLRASAPATTSTYEGVRASATIMRDIGQCGGGNCFNTAIALERRLAGAPASSVFGTDVTLDEGLAYLRTIYPQGTNMSFATRGAMERVLLAGGEGTRGVVFGTAADRPGHAFNVVVMDGRAVFLDGALAGRAAAIGERYKEFTVFFTQIGGGF